MYLNSPLPYMKVYVTKVFPSKSQQVVRKLFDLDSEEDFIKRILTAVEKTCPVEQLVMIKRVKSHTPNNDHRAEKWMLPPLECEMNLQHFPLSVTKKVTLQYSPVTMDRR